MSLESSEVRVMGTGHVYVAPVGTAFPTNISTAVSFAAGWRELGYVSEEGARFKFSREMNEVMAWQSYDPVRMVVKSVPKEVSFDLEQWNQFTLQLALGGGTVTEPTPDNYLYEPPAESVVDERALIIEGQDGNYKYRFCYRKTLNSSGVEFPFVRENPVMFPITMRILAADGGLGSFLLQTNDPNIGELVEAGS